MNIEMPRLPYANDALEPVISEETIGFHYGKHLQNYVNALASLVKGTEYEGMSVEDIVCKAPDGPIFNNAGQVLNHTLYFTQLRPLGKELKLSILDAIKLKVDWHNSAKDTNKPIGRVAKAIDDSFGSFDEFKTQFGQAAATLFGSGWAWLSQTSDGKLVITKEANAENPLRRGNNPLLCIDVWEHAYYLDYQNRRADYINDFWSLINWEEVEARMK
ncbi:MAG: superoxide dismutase [Bacteroidaceae bacterium]|nr:superoxide dismutase [Bacteroidaceae bacterium]